jgi:heme exporter protein A
LTASLDAKSLCLFRGDRCLFSDLEFSVQQGELLVIEGPNGSGKTSLLRGIAGILDFESGTVSWNGATIRENYQAFRTDVVWFSHRVGFKGDLNLIENLAFESGLRATDRSKHEQVIEALHLTRIVDLPFRPLSAGQQRRVALARMLLTKARLWMMDEPFTNLDNAGQALVVELIGEHLKAGGLCVVASHQQLDVAGSTKRLVLQ